VIGFTALAQGLLTGRYLDGIPEDSRAARGTETFDNDWLSEEMIEHLRALNDLASRRGQTLAQLALAWALRDERVTSLVIGASSVEQLEQNVDALGNLEVSDDELSEIDRHATANDVPLSRIERPLIPEPERRAFRPRFPAFATSRLPMGESLIRIVPCLPAGILK
jgi:L-glyceraldehyde 3-phosphate reductase